METPRMSTGPQSSDAGLAKRSVAPRFVPTLTEVVELAAPADASAPAAAGSASPLSLPAATDAAPSWRVAKGTSEVSGLDRDTLRDEVVHRVMQRVELALADRLPQSLQDVVQAHVQQLVPLLRDQIQATIDRAVDDALADEL